MCLGQVEYHRVFLCNVSFFPKKKKKAYLTPARGLDLDCKAAGELMIVLVI